MANWSDPASAVMASLAPGSCGMSRASAIRVRCRRRSAASRTSASGRAMTPAAGTPWKVRSSSKSMPNSRPDRPAAFDRRRGVDERPVHVEGRRRTPPCQRAEVSSPPVLTLSPPHNPFTQRGFRPDDIGHDRGSRSPRPPPTPGTPVAPGQYAASHLDEHLRRQRVTGDDDAPPRRPAAGEDAGGQVTDRPRSELSEHAGERRLADRGASSPRRWSQRRGVRGGRERRRRRWRGRAAHSRSHWQHDEVSREAVAAEVTALPGFWGRWPRRRRTGRPRTAQHWSWRPCVQMRSRTATGSGWAPSRANAVSARPAPGAVPTPAGLGSRHGIDDEPAPQAGAWGRPGRRMKSSRPRRAWTAAPMRSRLPSRSALAMIVSGHPRGCSSSNHRRTGGRSRSSVAAPRAPSEHGGHAVTAAVGS